MEKIKGFWKLIRPLNLLIVVFASFVAFMITGLCGNPIPFVKFLVPILLLAAFSNSLNDFMDAKLDKKAHPHRPIPSGLLSLKEAFLFIVILGFLAFLSSFFYETSTPRVVFIIGLILAILYDVYFKRIAFIGNFIVSFLTSFPFFLLALEIGSFRLLWYPVLCAIIYNLAREAVKDMEDFSADEEFGYRTLPLYLGERGVKYYVTFLLFLLLVFSIIAYITVFPKAVFLIYMSFLWVYLGLITWREKSFSKLSVVFKYFMILVLTGFLLGGAV
uniref:Prenyltransferase n=1 Tax=candidate division WOR-3 bacterium TaxID=2052148 RepID=A0A7C2P4P4_UNCW3